MKRSWAGAAILLGLLVIGLAVTRAMGRAQEPLALHLEQAAAFAADGDWEKAGAHLTQAQSQWERSRPWLACVADHTPMEEMDDLFARLTCYNTAGEEAEFAATCAALAQKARAIAAAQALQWWGFL